MTPGRSEATVRSADAVPPEPRSEVSSPETLVCVPTVELVTLTETVQESIGQVIAEPDEGILGVVEGQHKNSARLKSSAHFSQTRGKVLLGLEVIERRARQDGAESTWPDRALS